MPGKISSNLSTGLPGLDRMFKGLLPGDNLVWQVDSVEDYRPFIAPYVESARNRGEAIAYIRFAKHPPLLNGESGARIYELRPESGFESFINSIHGVIEETGRGGAYVFDCLSDLTADWFTDPMLANLFMLVCPYLYDVEALAYFALIRNHQSAQAFEPILETTQILTDVYRHKDRLYMQPVKVQQRHSPTMYMLHAWEGDEFRPVSESVEISETLTAEGLPGLVDAVRPQSVFDRLFYEAEETVERIRRGACERESADPLFRRLLRMSISRDEHILRLAEDCLEIEDVIAIRRRMVGTGLIGGKSVGMILARAFLQRKDRRWEDLFEHHDSFFIGSDVFYTYLVRNGCWWLRQRHRERTDYLDGAASVRQRILMGEFSGPIRRQFMQMLDYFGQSPIIVRSSSLLEDNYGNSFVGKYESVFCPNQGSRDKRLEDFLSAVRTVYASCMGHEALAYRARRGMLDLDEQMAVLVQRVSGAKYGNYYYPHLSGVAFSFNPYVWNEEIDPEAGVLRLVFGLGTRAVDRADDDYTRIVALNAPDRRPDSSVEDVKKYTQRKVDALDFDANLLVTEDFGLIARRSEGLPLERFAEKDWELERMGREKGWSDFFPWHLNFDPVLMETRFAEDMRAMVKILEAAYGAPVDVEFTANFLSDGEYRINLLQCRPFQVRRNMQVAEMTQSIAPENRILEARGAVIGRGRLAALDRIIYVKTEAYDDLPVAKRYKVARLIGEAMKPGPEREAPAVMLLGPGRWGTTTPSLGVPVSFAEISRSEALCEIVAMREGLAPDVSLGTHFFNELVELDILYTALFPAREGNFLNEEFLDNAPNRLADLAGEGAEFADVIKIIDRRDLGEGSRIQLYANPLTQVVLCFVATDEDTDEHGRTRTDTD